MLVARNVYDSNNMGRLKLFGAVLSAMQIDQTGRIAIVYLDHEMARAAGGTYEDTEGLINLPLTVKEIQAVVFFKQDEGEQYRVSMRSKGAIDIGAVAKEFGGGGHKNAAGCTVTGAVDALQKLFVEKIEEAIESPERADGVVESAGSAWQTVRLSPFACAMDGLLIIDKPAGPTSHDVVSRMRRAASRAAHRPHRHARSDGDRRPAAGRRPGDAARQVPERQRQVLRGGRAARLLDRHRRCGRAADRARCRTAPLPAREAIDAALDEFRGTFLQQPPAFSAKKIDGTRSYKLARARARRRSADAFALRPTRPT